jgi:AraC-like DNA-binding protein
VASLAKRRAASEGIRPGCHYRFGTHPLATAGSGAKIGPMPRRPRTADTTQKEFQRAVALIDARCGEFDFGVPTIAVDLACSTRQVQRIFSTNGTTVRDRLFAARMRKAAHALAAGVPVHRAADLNGYALPRHFSSAFRRHYGVRPSQVRRAGRLAARLQRRSQDTPPAAMSPRLAPYVKVWRQDHRQLLRCLRHRHRGTLLDDIFAPAIALRGPDLRTSDGRATVDALRSPQSRRRASHFSSASAPTVPGGARAKSRARPRNPAGRT